jgi:murein DD-endopeptidase MepM/ murein hydrolase activator NlpD
VLGSRGQSARLADSLAFPGFQAVSAWRLSLTLSPAAMIFGPHLENRDSSVLALLDDHRSVDRRRHPLSARARPHRHLSQTRGLPQVYRGGTRRVRSDVYDSDHSGRRAGGFRWLLSTVIAAGVGAVAIGAVLLGSMPGSEDRDGDLQIVRRLKDGMSTTDQTAAPRPQSAGLTWAVAKSDRQPSPQALQTAVRSIIHEQLQIKRDNRPFIQIKPYARIAARLASMPMTHADVVPPFNPIRLYTESSSRSGDADSTSMSGTRADVVIRVVELLGGILPADDGQELDAAEISDLVARAHLAEREAAQETATAEGIANSSAPSGRAVEPAAKTANTSVIAKSHSEPDIVEDSLERREVRVVRAGRGDTIQRVLLRLGTETWQARAMAEAARPIFADTALQPGHELHVNMVASITKPDRLEPGSFSIFADGNNHKVTVARGTGGEFTATATPIDSSQSKVAPTDGEASGTNSLYMSLYNAALTQGIGPDTILQILRIHATETDFRRRVGPQDGFELFFDLKDDNSSELALGEMLMTSVAVGGERRRYWRFRSPDGLVDYYDESGSNSRKFLIRKPIRSETVQLISGFGMRRHPLLGMVRMHSGVDWAGPIGTPIMAAGNGTIEEAKYKGDYGNYVRIRHANGYSTTYGHMSRVAPGIAEGVKVRQGQLIGFMGSTGLSTGSHLHYEVLINDRHVDPMSIKVPQERKLAGKALADFQKERARIEDLMRRPPVQTLTR